MYGKRLQRLRKQKLWTIEDVAKKVEIGRSTYAGYETESRKPPIDKLIKLSSLYNVSVDYILGIIDKPNIEELQRNASKYLRQDDLNWNGVLLTREKLDPIIEILNLVIANKDSNK